MIKFYDKKKKKNHIPLLLDLLLGLPFMHWVFTDGCMGLLVHFLHLTW